MESQGFFMATAPSHRSQYAAAAMPSSSSTFPPTLSAMAAPFVPTQVQDHPAFQPVTMQNPFLHHHPMMYQSPYQVPSGQMDSQTFYSTMPHHPHPGKHLNASSIKKHNRARSQQKERMYQEMMLAQHERASPPVSVSRKPSVVMPEGDYIGYYFKPKSDYVGYYMKDKANTTEMDSTKQMSKDEVATEKGQDEQMSIKKVTTEKGLAQQISKEVATHEGPGQQILKEDVAARNKSTQQMSEEVIVTSKEQGQQILKGEIATQEGQSKQMSKKEIATVKEPAQQVSVATQEVVISPGDDVDYRISRQGLTSFLPLLPLHGPILYQTKLKGDYNGPKESSTNTSDDYHGGFLPLLGPAPKTVSEHAFSDRDSESTKKEVIHYLTKSGGVNPAEHMYQGGRKEYVGYSYATVRGRKL